MPLYQLFYDGEEAPKKIKGVDLDGAEAVPQRAARNRKPGPEVHKAERAR